ncbi:hypothetical protein H8356DRAFT_1692749 [Neocallimastix lanati (nom. inval.)]|jgi:hypothetical protein|uniref:Uncharacterized protein n=1 Tax=Neocallimastix californiae TaxID=1754190 RepID=A0A1Y2DZ92_9FUNG|nr:hypothetical protein H8356DRAFT_1692749 [Neocallimastix sp. JGI-2020a]ORY64583.1 hypothetical protein LY90DRAFT_700863 [Neocallimastix californiae]|eukprot:ORY64583.1 hypothetical protein LY90DRAFT_700863 [Neocallimastix californiae]
MDSPNQEDKNERMNRFNLIIMLLILLLLVLFVFRRYVFNTIVRIKLKYNLIPTSYLDEDLGELESAKLISNDYFEEELDGASSSSGFKRNLKPKSNNNSVSFEEALNTGLSSSNFDVHSHNIQTQDERTGFDPKDTRILKNIMKKEHCDFDTARLVMQNLKFIKMGIDPATGMPLDSKAFTFESKSRR